MNNIPHNLEMSVINFQFTLSTEVIINYNAKIILRYFVSYCRDILTVELLPTRYLFDWTFKSGMGNLFTITSHMNCEVSLVGSKHRLILS